jgi:hypothetical protein
VWHPWREQDPLAVPPHPCVQAHEPAGPGAGGIAASLEAAQYKIRSILQIRAVRYLKLLFPGGSSLQRTTELIEFEGVSVQSGAPISKAPHTKQRESSFLALLSTWYR